MESVKLVVEVVRDQLNQLQKDVQALQNQQIKVKVDSSGAEALKQTVTDIKQVGQAAANISKTPVKLNVDTSGISALGEEYKRAVQVIDVNTGEVKSAIDEVALGIGRNAKVLTEYGEDVSRVTMKITEDYEKQAQAQDKAMGTAAAAHISQYNREMDSLREHVADLNKQLEASHASQAKFASNMQKGSFEDATRAVKDYYSALTDLSKTQTDISLTPNGWKSASGDWDALAAKLNRATTAFNALTSAENVNSLTDEQQIALKRTMAVEAEKYGLAAEKAANKQAASAAKAAENEAKLAEKQEQAAQAAKNQSFAQSKVNQDLSQASWLTKLLGNTLDVIIAKVVAWQVLNAGVATVVRSFRDAVKTIKEVDSALVTVQKTTDFNKQQLKDLTDLTYDLASAYGRTADELMNLNADFARAGFKDNIAQMTELAALLENVGDLEGDTASKFLLAANAAWQLNGNYDALMGIIDGMNAVTNEAAVDMEGLTTGITVAGSAFAAAGESAQTFTALLGTGIAATQRSGSEVARALRTVLMNVRQIKGELEDGEIIDEESISNAAKALSSIGISVAENGELRKFSDILTELAGKWDTLTSAEQSYIAESLGNKRQANTLISLLQNYGEYERQLGIYANGAGSALKENEIYLASWEAKTKQLSAAWTEFLSNLINTDLIKSALDILTGVIKVLDNDFVQFGATVAAVAGVFLLLKKAIIALSATNLVQFFAYIISGAEGAKIAVTALWEAFAASPVAIFTAIAVAIYGIVKAFDALDVKAEEHKKLIEEASNAYSAAKDELSKLEEKLKENQRLMQEGAKLGANDAYIRRIETENVALQRQIDLQKIALKGEQDRLAEAARNALTDSNDYQIADYGGLFGGIRWTNTDIYEYTEYLLEAAQATGEFDAELQSTVETLNSHAEALAIAAGGVENLAGKDKELYDKAIALVDAYRTFSKEVLHFGESAEEATETVNELSTVQEKTYENADELEKQCKAVSAALKDFDEYSNLTTDSINGLKDAIPKLVDALYDEEGRLTEAGIAALETANHMDTTRHAVEYLQMVADRLSMQNTINEIKRLQTQALTSAAAAIALNNALKSVGIDDPRMGPAMVARGEFKNLDDYLAHAFGSLGSDIDSYVSKYSTGSKLSSRSSGSSSSKSLTDEELERLKELVAYEKERYDYLEAEGAKRKKLIEQVDRIQDAERGLNKYVKSTANYKNAYAKAQQDINSLTDDELEILQDVSSVESDLLTQEEKKRKLEQESLQNERKLLEQNLAFMEQTKAPVVERVEAYRKEQELLHEEAELLRQSKAYQDGNADAVAEVVALSTQWWEIQKKINEEIEKPYRSLISYQDKQLELLKAIGASDEEMSEKAQEIYESWVALLETQLASGASQDDLLATVLEIITAKKNWLALEKDLTEEAKKQRELDLKYLSDTAALRKLDIQLAEKLGMSVEEQLAYMQQYADALIAQGKWMEENGASQLEINQLALEYLNIMEEMWELENGKKETTAAEDAHLKFLQDVITLRKGELALMEAMGLSTDQQIAKYRQILEALEAQGEYQKNIGASVADQNETATEYYNTLRKILELEKKQLSELADAAQELLETERDAATGPLQEQLDLLKKQHDEAKAQREEEEKLLAVEKARDALENAKRQRTVRTYNASTGQWEWVSNAKDVQSAEEALQKAQDALEEYQYQQKIKEIEAQIEAIKESYNGLIEAINEAANGIIDGKYDFQKAYKYITDKMRKLYDKYGIDLTNVMTRATDGFEEVSREIDATYREIETTALTFGDLNATLTEKTDDLSEELEEARAMLELAFGKLGATLDKSDYQLEKSADSLSEVADILSLLPGKLQDLINTLLQTASVDDYGGDSGGGSGGGGGSSDDNWGGGGNGAQGEYQHMAEKPDGTKYWITYKDGEPIASTMPIEEGDYVYNSSGTKKWKVSASRAAEMNASIAAYQAANGGGGSGGGSSGGGAGGGTSSGDSSSGGSTTDDDNHVPSWIDELFPVQASSSGASGNKGSAHSSMLSSSTLGNTGTAGRYGIKGASRQNPSYTAVGTANNTNVVNYNMTIGSWDMRHITEGTTMGEVWREMRSQARRLGLS